MVSRRRRSHLCLASAVVVTALLETRALAIGGPGAAATAAFQYVGRVQYETTNTNRHIGTGSYIRQGVALTAGHCVNNDAPTGQRFERFRLVGANPLFALGVQEPRYDPTLNVSDHDQSLLLVLNGGGAPAGGFPTLASAADGARAVNDSLEVIGFTGSADGGNPLRGVMKVNVVNPQRYTVGRNPNFTNRGDSGGPFVFDFGAGGGGKKIVATLQGGNSENFAGGTDQVIRVDTHRAFIDGDGVGGERALDRWVNGANPVWSNANRWNRTSANNNAVPGAHDIAILDPSTNADNGTTVTLDVNSANLDGLLNDVTLVVQEKILDVSNKSPNTPGSGVLNGGVINVGGGAVGTAGEFKAGWSIDNVGVIDTKIRGTTTVGAQVPGGNLNQICLNNNPGAVFKATGGPANLKTSVRNLGSVRAEGGNITIDGGATNATGGQLFSGANSRLDIARDVANEGVITVAGANAKMTMAGLNNRGVTESVTGGDLFANSINNAKTGRITVTSGKIRVFTAVEGFVYNAGTITLNTVTNEGYLTTSTITNNGTIKINPGSKVYATRKNENKRFNNDPAEEYYQEDSQYSTSAEYISDGTLTVGRNFLNFSRQNVAWNTSLGELRFVDADTLTPPDLATDPSLIFDPSPVLQPGRVVSRLMSPSLDLTDGSAPRGRPTLYVSDLTLTPGAADDAGSSLINIDGQSLNVLNKTTLDVRGGVVYASGAVSIHPDTIVTDSLNPGRPLVDMIRLISPGSVPSANFDLRSLNLMGAKYVALGAAFKEWNVDAGGAWHTNTNWTNSLVPNDTISAALFGSVITAPRAVATNSPATVNSVIFDSANSYTVAGPAAVSLNAGTGMQSAISVLSGSHTVSAPTHFATTTRISVGPSGSTLTLSGAMTGQSGVELSKTGAGTLEVRHLRVDHIVLEEGTTGVLSNGTSLGASRIQTLSLEGGTEAPTATLDLNDNDLMLKATSLVDTVLMISHARNFGAWDQPGITSTAAQNQPFQATTLAAVSGLDYLAADFNGFTVDPTDTLVKYTWYGDANLSGTVDFDDYVYIDNGYNNSLVDAGWINGDFDYSGFIDFDDYVLLDLAFNAQDGVLRDALAWLNDPGHGSLDFTDPAMRMIVKHYAEFGTPYATAFLSAVPEPAATLAILPCAAGWLARRRHRR